MGPNETSKLLHSKGNHKEDKKTTLRMGENICKRINGQKTVSSISGAGKTGQLHVKE